MLCQAYRHGKKKRKRHHLFTNADAGCESPTLDIVSLRTSRAPVNGGASGMATVPSAPLCADGVRTTLIAGDGVRGGGGDGATGTAGAADSVAAVTEYAHGPTTRALNVRTEFICLYTRQSNFNRSNQFESCGSLKLKDYWYLTKWFVPWAVVVIQQMQVDQ